MLVKQFAVGGDRNYGYIVADQESGKAVVVDPCYSPEMLVTYAEENDLDICYAFNTHGHHDHINGNHAFTKLTGIDVLKYGDIEPGSGQIIDDNCTLKLGSLTLNVIFTPGHTEDSICIYIGDAVITGDTLFVGKIGGTYTEDDTRQEYESLHNKLMKLPEETRVFPGHNYGVSPTSTIGHEKQTNPFIIQPDFESFVYLKTHWAEYKQKHGIK